MTKNSDIYLKRFALVYAAISLMLYVFIQFAIAAYQFDVIIVLDRVVGHTLLIFIFF